MQPIKIVLTGAPCGGKTTQIENLRNYLKEIGYKVIIVPETATELINSEKNYDFMGSLINFQDLILKYQCFKEESKELI